MFDTSDSAAGDGKAEDVQSISMSTHGAFSSDEEGPVVAQEGGKVGEADVEEYKRGFSNYPKYSDAGHHRSSVTSHRGGFDSVATLPPPEMPTWARDSDSDDAGQETSALEISTDGGAALAEWHKRQAAKSPSHQHHHHKRNHRQPIMHKLGRKTLDTIPMPEPSTATSTATNSTASHVSPRDMNTSSTSVVRSSGGYRVRQLEEQHSSLKPIPAESPVHASRTMTRAQSSDSKRSSRQKPQKKRRVLSAARTRHPMVRSVQGFRESETLLKKVGADLFASEI